MCLHPHTDSLEPTYQQLQKMKLDKSPFVVVSVIGQELLTNGFHGASVVVLEAGLKIGTCSLKLRGSVFSALSSAYWSLGNSEKSTAYMQQDLEVTKTLGKGRGESNWKEREQWRNWAAVVNVSCNFSTGDQSGECRAHGNLGSALFSRGSYREALANHRNQLVLAMKLKDREVRLHAIASVRKKNRECAHAYLYNNACCIDVHSRKIPLTCSPEVTKLETPALILVYSCPTSQQRENLTRMNKYNIM